jgi:hypothetical protein
MACGARVVEVGNDARRCANFANASVCHPLKDAKLSQADVMGSGIRCGDDEIDGAINTAED